MTANYSASGENHRILSLKNQSRCILNRVKFCILLRCNLLVKRSLRLIHRHLCDVNRKIYMGCTRFFSLRILERESHNLSDRIRTHNHLRPLRDRLKHLCQIKELMTGDMHALCSHLTGDCDKRSTVTVCIRNTGYKVCRTRSKRGQTHTCFSGQSSVDICHKCSSLFMSRCDEADLRIV